MDTEASSTDLAHSRTLLISLCVVGLLFYVLSYVLARQFGSTWRLQNMSLHAAIEMCGAVVAMMVAYVLLRLEAVGEGSSFNQILAAALIGMAVLDGTHALMPNGKVFVWLHSAATGFGGLLFALVWVSKRLPHSTLAIMPVIGFIAAILISVISLIFPDYVPEMLVNNQFTLTALLLNIGGGCLLLAAGVKLLLTHRQSNKPEDLVFCLQCVLLGVGAIMFQYSAPWDLQWWNWHALRLFGYCIALWLVANATRRFEARLFSLNETLEQRVCERTDEYERANHSLQETIDQLERTRNELVQAEKLAALGALVAGVAHELNTPLGNAKLAVSTLSEDLMTVTANYQEGKLSRSQIVQYLKNGKEIINLACRAVDRAVDLVASFKQVAVDQTSERRRSFDLAAVIEETVAALRPSYKCRPWQFIIDVPDGIEMDSYPGPLGQIVINMVLNSINHGFDGREQGNVTITGRRDAIIPGQIILIFHDDGAGIAPENLDRVFDPFFTTRLGFGGSGIGLNVTYRIATSVLGGSIAVESAPGFGATFKLTIPQTAPVQI